jgi:mono/diheme cytochrome c family protein
MGKALRTSVLLLSVAIGGGVAFGQETASQSQPEKAPPGEAIFKRRCAVCHSTVADKKLVGPSLHSEMSGPTPAMTPAQVRAIIVNGKGTMPGLKDQLSEQEMDDLIAYLKTQ